MLHETVRQLYSEQPQRTLYHYTSLTGLMGIVEQRSFWVSDIRYLKDSEELRHLGRWLNGTAGRREQTEGRQKVLTQFREWLRHRLLIDFGPTLFVGSFTERGYLLSQWRGYCQHAYHGIFREIEPELLRIATLVKDDSFHEEKEWRVVSPVFSDYIGATSQISRRVEYAYSLHGIAPW